MTNIAHASLTGAELHEPKGADTAALGEVYVADGNGSGAWSSVGTSAFTGQIADFLWPVVQEGWLECDGSDINISTYSNLYAVMTIQQTGTRVSGSSSITSLSSTSNMKVGYYVFGTGIAAGTTISAINSSTQITLSNNASSSGTATVVVSPWYLNTGTIRLPDLTTAGRYRRSRLAGQAVGTLQSSQNLAHTHTGSGTSSGQSAAHTHTFSGSTGAMSANATHSHSTTHYGIGSFAGGDFVALSRTYNGAWGSDSWASNSVNTDHTHAYSGTTSSGSADHTHTYSFTSSSNGGTEARPVSIVVMTCVKT